MGLGSTAKKVQIVADLAEKSYKKLDELRAQLQELRGTVEETGDRVEHLEREVAAQRAVLEAVAEEHGLDTEALVADADLSPVDDPSGAASEAAVDETADGSGDASATDDADGGTEDAAAAAED